MGFMKKFSILMATFLMVSSSVFSACGGHTHSFELKKEESGYLKAEATCQSKAQYYYSCECGEAGNDIFEVGDVLEHDYTAETVEEKYLKDKANCQAPAVYYMSCTMCGKKGYDFSTFEYGELGGCNYTEEVATAQYLKDEATIENAAVYYKSWVCGAKGTETFDYGTPLKEYTDAEKVAYKPTSLTVTLYDSENSVYGFSNFRS